MQIKRALEELILDHERIDTKWDQDNSISGSRSRLDHVKYQKWDVVGVLMKTRIHL